MCSFSLTRFMERSEWMWKFCCVKRTHRSNSGTAFQYRWKVQYNIPAYGESAQKTLKSSPVFQYINVFFLVYCWTRSHFVWTGYILLMTFVVFSSTLFTASTDKTVCCWDYETGGRIKKLKGHQSFVNSCCPSRRGNQMIVSGSDDSTIKACLRDTK